MKEKVCKMRGHSFLYGRGMRIKVQTTPPEQIIVPAFRNWNIGGKDSILLINWKKIHTYYFDQQSKDLQKIYYFKGQMFYLFSQISRTVCFSPHSLKSGAGKKGGNLGKKKTNDKCFQQHFIIDSVIKVQENALKVASPAVNRPR